jgi:hypothetical protein
VDSGEPAGPGSAQQTEEHGFSLVVTGVRGGNAVETMSGGGALEECITRATSSGFQREVKKRGQGGNIVGLKGGIERKPRRQLCDEARIGIRVRPPKTVIEVKHKEHDPKAGSKFGECPEQSYGVRATTDGHADALARADETMPAQIAFKRLEHRTMITEVRRYEMARSRRACATIDQEVNRWVTALLITLRGKRLTVQVLVPCRLS